MNTPEYKALMRQLKQLELERNMGLHAYCPRKSAAYSTAIERVRRDMAKLKGDFLNYQERTRVGKVR